VWCVIIFLKKGKKKAQKNEQMKVQKKKKKGTCVLAGKGLVFFLIFGVYVYLWVPPQIILLHYRLYPSPSSFWPHTSWGYFDGEYDECRL